MTSPSYSADMSGKDWLNQLSAPWQAAVELAWESFLEGNPPVGAVVADPNGVLVARGRSQRLSQHAGPGKIIGTNLAHAEISALIALPRADYSTFAMYTTLRPCFLCTTGIVQCRVGRVAFAAVDPVVAGVERLPEISAQMARRWPTWHQEPEGPLTRFCSLLPTVFEYERGNDGDVRHFEEHNAVTSRMANDLVKSGRIAQLRQMSSQLAMGEVAALVATTCM